MASKESIQRLKEAIGSESLVPSVVVDETIAELERLRAGYFNVYMDGNAHCAVRHDFINLQESNAGFGVTPGDAIDELLSRESNAGSSA